VASDVPEGKGVSSSAALEVAVMTAIAAAFDIVLPPREIAILCQKVENLVVGAPCGVMDQMTAACGEADRLLALRCQPAELQGHVALPEDLTVFGIDSGIRHAVSGADYVSVRVGAFMGYRILAEAAGLAVRVGARGAPVTVDDPRWHGHLANLSRPTCRNGSAAVRIWPATAAPPTRSPASTPNASTRCACPRPTRCTSTSG
jgi:L-arabinokinase